jgi:hypothetical protein
MISVLLAAGASPGARDIVSSADVLRSLSGPQDGQTPLHLIFDASNDPLAIQLLYKAGADLFSEDNVRANLFSFVLSNSRCLSVFLLVSCS